MTTNNTVFLLVGPRGAGKSHYAKRLASKEPKIDLISRDEILIRHFGSADIRDYGGGHYWVERIMNRLLRRKLSTQSGIRIILDCWTGAKEERKRIIFRLRQYGAEKIVALYFTTEVELVKQWFWLKPGVAKTSEIKDKQGQGLTFFSENAPERDYGLFHKLAGEINSDGFDRVIRINPLEPLIALNQE